MSNHPPLKAREIEILHLIAEGLTNVEIGERLHIAYETVRWYNKQIFEKLAVTNRLQAVNRAAELGFLTNYPQFSAATPATTPKTAVQYVANGNVHLAYQIVGNGPVDLLFIHGFLSHLELAWENPEFAHFFEELGRFARVILFDKRGMGLSDRIQGAPTLENTMDDALTVLDAADSKQAFIMGTSEGAAAAVLLSATFPERVHGLILYGAMPKVVRTHDEPVWADALADFEAMIVQMQQSWGGPWAINNFAPSRAEDEKFRSWWAMILRAASSPSSIKAVMEIIQDVDIRALLPQIQVRTLVIHKTDDRIAPIEAGRYFATQMPNARWVELPGNDHIYFVESTAVLTAIAQFCQEDGGETAVKTKIAIILQVLYATDEATTDSIRKYINESQPQQVNAVEGGVIALFDSPLRALLCALRLRQTAVAPALKISLHVGECSRETNLPTESVLAMTAMATRFANPGEIVISQSLRDILAGSGFKFNEKPINHEPGQMPLPLFTLS